ncbi:MAG: hypothetical protein N2654_00370 [Deltaproteobacteria bacterium]|nr:hypothetical protein [Deltaproteobacteria bacterium]
MSVHAAREIEIVFPLPFSLKTFTAGKRIENFDYHKNIESPEDFALEQFLSVKEMPQLHWLILYALSGALVRLTHSWKTFLMVETFMIIWLGSFLRVANFYYPLFFNFL